MKYFMGFISCFLFTGCAQQVDIDEEVESAMAELTLPLDYVYDIKPILSDRCFACHGPDQAKQQAGLRLDETENAFARNPESGRRAIVPGKPGRSELVRRILTRDSELLMPTPESHLSLSTQEKAILIQWIREGAIYKPHWAFTKAQKAELPKVSDSAWVKNDIDRFILKKLEEKRISPTPEADKATLIRRVSIDLTGLPPSPEAVDAFLDDPRPDAYERLVDRLLASPHFGEHMTVPWLDAARYADTHGYQDDGNRTAWPYRDWVIRSFNSNLPFDKFVTWQLAGDLLPNPSRDQILATAFNRMHQQSQEGGIIPEEYRTEYVADRVDTFGKTFLGLTMECARCHDHKYDPISQKDYFSLFAFFNNNNENGQIPYNGEASPTITLPTPEAEKRLGELTQIKLNAEEKRDAIRRASEPDFKRWLTTLPRQKNGLITFSDGLAGHYKFDDRTARKLLNGATSKDSARVEGDDSLSVAAIKEGKFGKSRYIFGENAIHFPKPVGWYERHEPFTISIWLKLHDKSTVGSLIHKSNGVFNGYRGWNIFREADGTFRFTLSNVWPENAIELISKEKVPTGEWVHLAVSYDGLSRAKGASMYLNGRAMPVITMNDHLSQSLLYGKKQSNVGGMHDMLIGRLSDQYTKDFEVDELRIYSRCLNPLEVRGLFTGKNEAEILFADKGNIQELEWLHQYFLENYDTGYRTALKEFRAAIEEETKILDNQPDVMVMKERRHHRKTYLLKRGVYDAPDYEVNANTPDQFFKIPAAYPKNRLGLAKWLLHPDHPLFSRVTVNRFWQNYFGKGLVLSSSDFGNQGELPTHPELLDWLAVWFRKSGWNVKALQKLIVSSATYRQSSKASPGLLERDSDNHLYARAPAYRMTAEQIRDNALAASGLLNRHIGGPSVYPYQPEGLWEALASRKEQKYRQQHGDTLYRRSLYTVWKRSAPPPMMLNFDASERHFCVTKRQKTSTPLQALVTMNAPQFVEASRALAQRALKRSSSVDGQITYIFTALTSREPSHYELATLTALYHDEYRDFVKNAPYVRQLLAVGEYPADPALDDAKVAAFTLVASTVMNFDEFIIKR